MIEPLLNFPVDVLDEERLTVREVAVREEVAAVGLIEGPQAGTGPAPQPPVDGPAILSGMGRPLD